MTIRPAVPADAAAIAAVHVDAWRAAYAGLLPERLLRELSVSVRTAQWRDLLERWPGASAHVALCDGAVGGFVAVLAPVGDATAPSVLTMGSPAPPRQDGGRLAELAALYVAPRRWRSGVGTALIERALAELQAPVATTVTLWVLAGNAPAVALYRRHGFAADGAERRREATGGAHELRMRRVLPARAGQVSCPRGASIDSP